MKSQFPWTSSPLLLPFLHSPFLHSPFLYSSLLHFPFWVSSHFIQRYSSATYHPVLLLQYVYYPDMITYRVSLACLPRRAIDRFIEWICQQTCLVLSSRQKLDRESLSFLNLFLSSFFSFFNLLHQEESEMFSSSPQGVNWCSLMLFSSFSVSFRYKKEYADDTKKAGQTRKVKKLTTHRDCRIHHQKTNLSPFFMSPFFLCRWCKWIT